MGRRPRRRDRRDGSTLIRMSDDQERERIRAVDRMLTERYGVVLDDVVLRMWGDGRPDATLGMLASALAESGVGADEDELRAVARAISRGEALPPVGSKAR